MFSDSQAALQLIATNPNVYITLAGEVKDLLCELNQNGEVILHWVRGHNNIEGNEIVDKAVKWSCNNDRSVNSYLTNEESLSILAQNFVEYWNEY